MLYLAIAKKRKEKQFAVKTYVDYYGSYYTPSRIFHITHNIYACISVMLVVLTEKRLYMMIATKLYLFFFVIFSFILYHFCRKIEIFEINLRKDK